MGASKHPYVSPATTVALQREKSINSYLGQRAVCQVQLQEKKKIFETDVTQFKAGRDKKGKLA